MNSRRYLTLLEASQTTCLDKWRSGNESKAFLRWLKKSWTIPRQYVTIWDHSGKLLYSSVQHNYAFMATKFNK